MIPLILSFLLAGFSIAIHWYYAAGVAVGFGCWFTYSTINFLKRTIKDTKRLIDAINFSELNISLRSFVRKGLFPELIPMMENAISRFNTKLQQTEIEHQFYDTLLNRIDSAIVVIGKTHEIEWINKAALDEFGKPHLRHIADFAAVSPELPNILEKIVQGDVKIIKSKKDGYIRQLAITTVIFSSRGKELKLLSFKNIQSVLEESETDAWKKLIRVLTHEMMNSISPIISLAETFSEQDTEKEKDYELMGKAMQTIHRRSKGLVEFVENYRKLMRIPAPVMDTFYAKEMMNDISNLLNAEGIRFSYKILPEDLALFADRTQIEQVLINLIKNADEACVRKELPEIDIQLFRNEYGRTVIVVSDNGCGILPEVLDKIFIPFFTTKQGGSGIGLSICRQIMISHGGNITVESEPDKGTRVILSF
jgi:nitrogen fixation/metabolism regulation signal transduction histidine kinase